ncbi:SHOCT domain-containing protein [Haloplanus litoreus]|uniref:SHOCT domain-containing protein n=1 Tax=Haloplanus litoreus TaxID=767515 RepID=A0ABD5ZZN0_9EURY
MASTELDATTIVVLVLGALLVLPLLTMTLWGGGTMGGPMGGPMMGGGMWGGGTWGGETATGWVLIAGLLSRLLTLLVLVGAGYLGYRALTGRGDGADQAVEELRMAYARGDLTDEEYERRRQTLEEDE